MSNPVCRPRACDIVPNYILKMAQVLSKAKLNKEINLVLLFDICTVVFVCFLSSLLCAHHAATDSLSRPQYSICSHNVRYLFPVFPHSLSNL